MIEGVKEAFSVGGTANTILLVLIVVILIATGVMTCLVWFVNPAGSQVATINNIASETFGETTSV